MKYKIITISRQFGSGGRTVGKELAEKLGVPCYDQELIEMFASKSGFSAQHIEELNEESTKGGLLPGREARVERSLQYSLWQKQRDVILELAEKEPCVIVGRCADYVLAEHPRCVRVFVHADFESRVKRICAEHSIPELEARERIVKTDKRRANYYNYYTSHKWGKVENYDLSLSTDKLGTDGAARFIVEYAKTVYPD